MVDNGVTEGGFTKENLQREIQNFKAADKLTAQIGGDVKAAGEQASGNGKCPESHLTDPASWFASSLCGMGMALYQGGQKLVDFAKDQLMAVLGLTDGSTTSGKIGY